MRKGLGIALSVLGGFLVVLGLLAQFYAPGQLMKTPLDVDTTTRLAGTAELSDGTGGTDTFPVKAFSVTRADSERSDDDVVVFQNSTCLVKDEGEVDGCVSADDPDGRLLSATTDNFATDRVEATAVNDPKYLPASAEDKEGLVNKWPFNAEKKTYPYWDGTADEAVDAVYERTEELDGTDLYVYKVTVDPVPTELPGGASGTFSSEKEIWVEPTTGSIINQVDQQQRIDEDGNPFLLVDLAFTDEQRKSSLEEAQSSLSSLNLIRKTLPLVGLIVGIQALIAGIFLLLGGRRKSATA